MAGGDRTARVVGRTRARVLAAVRNPQTTVQVATRIGCATSTASEHLTDLHRAGLVVRRREGRYVYYELSERGRHLLALLEDDARLDS